MRRRFSPGGRRREVAEHLAEWCWRRKCRVGGLDPLRGAPQAPESGLALHGRHFTSQSMVFSSRIFGISGVSSTAALQDLWTPPLYAFILAPAGRGCPLRGSVSRKPQLITAPPSIPDCKGRSVHVIDRVPHVCPCFGPFFEIISRTGSDRDPTVPDSRPTCKMRSIDT